MRAGTGPASSAHSDHAPSRLREPAAPRDGSPVIAGDVFADQATLTGPRVRLEPLTLAWLEPVLTALTEPEVLRLTGTHATFTRDQITGWLSTRVDAHDRADWAAVRIGDGRYLGEVAVNDLDTDNESASYRIALAAPDLFGRGYGTEITRLVLDHVFGDVGLHRLGLEVFAFNERATRVYEKCGFVREGLRRDALLWDGRWHDAVLMGAINPRPATD